MNGGAPALYKEIKIIFIVFKTIALRPPLLDASSVPPLAYRPGTFFQSVPPTAERTAHV
jgi:hypothetical protein